LRGFSGGFLHKAHSKQAGNTPLNPAGFKSFKKKQKFTAANRLT
jgi:hypothetical protein